MKGVKGIEGVNEMRRHRGGIDVKLSDGLKAKCMYW